MRPRGIARAVLVTLGVWLIVHRGCGSAAPVATETAPPASRREQAAVSPALGQDSAIDRAARTPEERRALYARLLDQKISRFHDEVDADCSDDDLGFVFDDLARVRDAIIASAIETSRGDKTKADQRAYETRLLKQHRTDVCRWASTSPLSSACAAHFHDCDSPAD